MTYLDYGVYVDALSARSVGNLVCLCKVYGLWGLYCTGEMMCALLFRLPVQISCFVLDEVSLHILFLKVYFMFLRHREFECGCW